MMSWATLAFGLACGWYDGNELRNKRYIPDHTSRVVFRGVSLAYISAMTQTNFLGNCALFYIVFEPTLNLVWGQKWNYVGHTAWLDIQRHKVFGKHIGWADPLSKVLVLGLIYLTKGWVSEVLNGFINGFTIKA